MAVNATGMGNAGTSSAGQSFLSTLIARLPYTFKVLQNAIEANPKYDIFNDLTSRKEQRLRQQSIFQTNEGGAGMMMIDKRYHQIMYADVDTDKVRRIMEYRKMAGYAELADCIEEIADEALVKDEQGEIVKLLLKGDHDKVVVEAVKAEWDKFIQNFDLANKGWEYIRQFLIEGELYFENVISETRPDYGVIGVIRVPTELINTVYDNLQNQMIQGYLLRKPMINPKKTISNQTQEELVILDKNQITYMHSGLWNEDRTIRLPYIENSRRAYKQLSLVEDSIIIYRLVRAPERLVFKVDVGNMPVPKAEEYIKKLMQQYWSRKNFDSSQGRVGNTYDPQSMLDAYWFTKRGQSEGTTVEQLPGGCLAMDTKVKLLDGRCLTLTELTNEHNNGIQNWTYSCNPENGHIVPGKISWAGVTQKSAKVMKLTFDNGKDLICTPDHKFPTIVRGKLRADELLVGDSIYALQTNEKIWKGEFTLNLMKRFVRNFGYKNYAQFRNEFPVYNHKVTKIEFLVDPIEVGTLTIDKDEEIHNYHTFATDCGVMTFNSNLGTLDDLMYFVKKLYKSLKVPTTRLDAADPFKDGTEITREELRFARFIIRIQGQISQGLKQSFITHLQLREKSKTDSESKSIWEKFKLREHQLNIEFNPPTYFATMREQQIFDLKSNNFAKLTGSELISQSFAQKYYLGLTDDQMAENREWLRKDAALSWEIQNIVSTGPDFRKQMSAMADLEEGNCLPASKRRRCCWQPKWLR